MVELLMVASVALFCLAMRTMAASLALCTSMATMGSGTPMRTGARSSTNTQNKGVSLTYRSNIEYDSEPRSVMASGIPVGMYLQPKNTKTPY